MKVAATGFFGPAFTKLVEEHYDGILKSPPRLVLHSFIDDPRVTKLVNSDAYRKVMEAPEHNLGNSLRYPTPRQMLAARRSAGWAACLAMGIVGCDDDPPPAAPPAPPAASSTAWPSIFRARSTANMLTRMR